MAYNIKCVTIPPFFMSLINLNPSQYAHTKHVTVNLSLSFDKTYIIHVFVRLIFEKTQNILELSFCKTENILAFLELSFSDSGYWDRYAFEAKYVL